MCKLWRFVLCTKPDNFTAECFIVCLCPYSDRNRDRGSFIGALGWLFIKTHGPASVDQVRPYPVFHFPRMFVQCTENTTQSHHCISLYDLCRAGLWVCGTPGKGMKMGPTNIGIILKLYNHYKHDKYSEIKLLIISTL